MSTEGEGILGRIGRVVRVRICRNVLGTCQTPRRSHQAASESKKEAIARLLRRRLRQVF